MTPKTYKDLSPEAAAQLIAAAPDMLNALELITNAFIHKDGDIKGNKARTAIFKYCPDMCEAMNAAHNVFIYKLQVKP
jgi:hypothetical protein